MDVTELVFELKALKANIKGILEGCIVAMVANCATKLTAPCSTMTGQFFDAMIWTSTDIEWL